MGGYSFGSGVPTWNGIPMIGAFQKDFSGSTYFVDNNSGSDGNKGDSWEKPFKTLAKAIAISNINIAGGASRWARRNTIFYAADTETADLTVFPNKCDVIGCGSYDANKRAGITGLHAPATSGHQGSRFFNIWFKAPADAHPMITLTNASSGVEFHNCMFDGVVGTITHGISATASTMLKVIGCEFIGGFVTADIYIGTGAAVDVVIQGNTMYGSAGDGILTHSGTTVSYRGLIADNIISSTKVCINDASGKFNIIGNRGVTADVHGVSLAGAVVGTTTLAVDNYFTGADFKSAWPALEAIP